VEWAQPEQDIDFITYTADNLADWLHEISGETDQA